MSAEIIVLYAFTGMLAGFLAGLLGVGGGLIIVPALLGIFYLQGFDPAVSMHIALGTSLATIIPTSISSARAHHTHGMVQWLVVKDMTLGLFFGGVLGALVVKQLESETLQIIFALFAITIALKLFLNANAKEAKQIQKSKAKINSRLVRQPISTIVGFLISAVSAVVGIGGGSLSVPFLHWVGLSIQQSVATSAALGLPIAISGVLAFVWIGFDNTQLPNMSLGYVYLPAFVGVGLMSVLFAPLGAKVAHRLPEKVLKIVFSACLLLVALLLLVR